MGVGILAPVPCMHLRTPPGSSQRSAEAVCAEKGRVAFASDARWFFEDSAGQPDETLAGISVLIYASRPDLPDPCGLFIAGQATWHAVFVRWLRWSDRAKGHPDPSLRPDTTSVDGFSFGFWEVAQLTRLPTDQWIRFSEMTSAKDGKLFAPDFKPEGPMLVHHDAL